MSGPPVPLSSAVESPPLATATLTATASGRFLGWALVNALNSEMAAASKHDVRLDLNVIGGGGPTAGGTPESVPGGGSVGETVFQFESDPNSPPVPQGQSVTFQVLATTSVGGDGKMTAVDAAITIIEKPL
jgi:hypothetical protein